MNAVGCCWAACSTDVNKVNFVDHVAQVFIFTDLLSESLLSKLQKVTFEIFNGDNGFTCFRFRF